MLAISYEKYFLEYYITGLSNYYILCIFLCFFTFNRVQKFFRDLYLRSTYQLFLEFTLERVAKLS